MKNLVLALFSVVALFSCTSKSTSITQMVKFTVKPEFIQKFKKAQVNSLNNSLKEEGNLEMKLYANNNIPNVFYVFSKWKNEEVYELHKNLPHSKALAPLFKEALQSVPEIIRLNDTNPGHIDSKELIATGNEQAIFIPFTVEQEYKERVIKQLEKHVSNSRKEEANIFFDFYEVEGQENTFYIYENWKNSNAVFNVHNNQSYTKETLALLNKAIVGDFKSNIELVTEYDENTLNTTYSAVERWEISGSSMPESIFASPTHKWLYVSNVNQKGKIGYISKVSKEGKVIEEKWIDNLSGPCGSDMYQGKLYVADQKFVRIIDVEKGEIIKSIKSETAVSLNDVSITSEGKVFISDVPGGKIYTINNNKLQIWLESPKIHHPNGVLVQDEDLIVVDFGKEMNPQSPTNVLGSVYRVNIATKEVKAIPSGHQLGVLDGVVAYKNGFLVSAPMVKEIYYLTENERTLLRSFPFGPADINIDGDNLFLPYIFGDKIASYKIVKEKWHRITSKEEYLEKCADVYYGEKGGKSVATKNGIIKGNFDGKELKGTWDWNGTFFSRTSTIGDIDLGRDDLVIEVTPTKMRLTLQKGTGISVVYTQQ
ncbi:antibiotic biosynthesis monooxygenase [uncultured Lutibacter sp.]|uniref:antibiotic biosynthesis monooxygenase n=1 Tax=uncultured Lutibacter sp. TaxID=437739 RepID=UPI00260682D3|nr:antibiotic biosynthesis monooxygenase [uncultured Lutibacter sp.]